MPFADEFINAFLAGQQSKYSKQDQEHKQRQYQYEAEDRDVEKQLLQHRLKELKLTERLKAREAAQVNLQALSGMSRSDLTPDQMEGDVLPASTIDMQTGLPQALGQMKQVTIPGISPDLLGGVDIPEVRVRPQTMEDQLQELFAQNQIKAATTVHPIARGGGLVNGLGQTIVAPQAVPERPIPVTERDKSGKETTTYRLPSEVAGQSFTKERLPQRTSSTQMASQEDINDVVEGVRTGRRSSDLSGLPGATRFKAEAALLKSGFNMKAEQADTKALAAHFQAVNSGVPANLQIAAETVTNALDDLETINKDWNRTTFGPFSWATIAANKLKGGDAAQKAKDAEEAIRAVHEGLAELKGVSGAATVNQGIKDADTILAATQGKTDMGTAIGRLRKSVAYRTSAIRNLQAILPSQAGGGAVQFEYDPATGAYTPVSK